MDLIKPGSGIDIFYAKTCATTKISTVAGYHVVLATLLCKVAVSLIKFAIKDIKMTKKNIKIWLPYSYVAPYNIIEEYEHRIISAVHESRNVRHTKKCYAMFVQQLFFFFPIYKAELAVSRTDPF